MQQTSNTPGLGQAALHFAKTRLVCTSIENSEEPKPEHRLGGWKRKVGPFVSMTKRNVQGVAKCRQT